MILISVIIPVYRNAETLQVLHQRLTTILEPLGEFEIIFVNDASPDTSLEVLKALGASDSRVKVINLTPNVGQNRALMVGFRFATGGTAVVMDADLQDNPEAIPPLLTVLQQHRAQWAGVFATRTGDYHTSVWDRLTGWGFKRLFHLLSAGRIPFGAGLFFVVDRDLIQQIAGHSAGYPYLIGFMARTGLKFGGVPSPRARRPVGRSAYTPWKRLKLAGLALLYTFSPLAGHAPSPEPHIQIIQNQK